MGKKKFVVNEDALREQGYDQQTIDFIKEETEKLETKKNLNRTTTNK
jgi:hypothetical protein